MNAEIQNTAGFLLVSTLGLVLLAACHQPSAVPRDPHQSRITGLSLKDRSGAATPFQGYYAVDGTTNPVQGHMPANFALDAHRLAYEITAEHPGSKGWMLTVTRFDASRGTIGSESNEAGAGQNTIRGTMYVETNWWDFHSTASKN